MGPAAPRVRQAAARPAILLLLSLLLWTLAPARPLLAQEGPSPPAYRLDASLDYQAGTLQVGQVVRFRNRTGLALDRAVFHVVAAAEATFELSHASAQGRMAATRLDGTVLDILFPAPLAPGATAEVELSYRLALPRGPGRMSAGPSALALGNWLPLLAVHRAEWDRHRYTTIGDPGVSEAADFDLRLTTSEAVVLATGGEVVEANGTRFHVRASGARDLALSLSPGYVVAEAWAGTAPVRAYTGSPERSRFYAEAAAVYLDWYASRFGAYPFESLALAETSLPPDWGGMEYPGLVFLSPGLPIAQPLEGGYADLLIGHEVAHQWFYAWVGNDQTRDPWLDEAFAQYLPYYSYKDRSPELYARLWPAQPGPDVAALAAGGRPVDASVYDFPGNPPYVAAVYQRGGRFVDELRQTMGDAAFERGLADLVFIFGGKLASPLAVLDLFQRHTAANLNPLVARYFSYQAFAGPAPSSWRVEMPDSPWRGSAALAVTTDFPLAEIEVWLDNRRLYVGPDDAPRLSLADVEPGSYALLVRVRDRRSVAFERAERIAVVAP